MNKLNNSVYENNVYDVSLDFLRTLGKLNINGVYNLNNSDISVTSDLNVVVNNINNLSSSISSSGFIQGNSMPSFSGSSLVPTNISSLMQQYFSVVSQMMLKLSSDLNSITKIGFSIEILDNEIAKNAAELLNINSDVGTDKIVVGLCSMSGEIRGYDNVPLYFQTDYPDVKYGNYGATIAKSGCGITSLAMVASYLTDTEILPDELAEMYPSKASKKGGSCYTLFRDSQEDLGIKVEQQTWDFKEVYKALENGQVVIAHAKPDSVFTNRGHYIVLTGLTEDGKVLVNDPYEDNYNRTDHAVLQDGFANGFDVSEFKGKKMKQFWIYEKKDANNNIDLNL